MSMECKFISIDGLKKVLSTKEMKNILGGSGVSCYCICDGREWWAACPPGVTAEECATMSCPGVDCASPQDCN